MVCTTGATHEGLAEVTATADERDGELSLVDVVVLVGHGQNLRLVDVVHLDRLQNLSFYEVADPCLTFAAETNQPNEQTYIVESVHILVYTTFSRCSDLWSWSCGKLAPPMVQSSLFRGFAVDRHSISSGCGDSSSSSSSRTNTELVNYLSNTHPHAKHNVNREGLTTPGFCQETHSRRSWHAQLNPYGFGSSSSSKEIEKAAAVGFRDKNSTPNKDRGGNPALSCVIGNPSSILGFDTMLRPIRMCVNHGNHYDG